MNISQLHPYSSQLSLHCLQQVFTGILQVPDHMALEHIPNGLHSPLLSSQRLFYFLTPKQHPSALPCWIHCASCPHASRGTFAPPSWAARCWGSHNVWFVQSGKNMQISDSSEHVPWKLFLKQMLCCLPLSDLCAKDLTFLCQQQSIVKQKETFAKLPHSSKKYFYPTPIAIFCD